MVQAELRIQTLPQGPLDAAAAFHRDYLEAARSALQDDAQSLAIILPAASVDHDDWRRAIARDMAREYAPRRVNLLSGADSEAVSVMLAYLRDAPGVTGQYLALHDQS